MSAPKRPSDDQDPDYVSPGPTNAKQQKIYEDTARANTANKIIGIVEKEFSKEIDVKEKEVLAIQNRLHKALKTLHLLRYVVITDFYNRKQCQAQTAQTGEAKQTQIHPAIKRLIGKAPRRQKGIGLGEPGPSTSKIDHCQGYLDNGYDDDNKEGVKIEIEKRLGIVSSDNDKDRDNKDKRDKISSEEESIEPPKKIPRYIPPKSNIPAGNSPSRGVRHKVRKRIVVGNISKWIPPDWREDGASHKWMMYVRGSKDVPDIYDFVSKVRFFLHPSYQPNDVVQVTSPPFHLSRRGWGEFPLRVQLHFKNALNKPMDIIHYLKLDRTYTGLQTLGSETVVDIWIHTTTPHNFKKNLDDFESAREDEPKLKKNEIDLSVIKNEFPSQGCEALDNNSTRILQSSIKTEPIEERRISADDDNSQLINENCIKIEHNYVSNNYKTEECTEIVIHSLENNVTIKHSSTPNNDQESSNKSNNSDPNAALIQKENNEVPAASEDMKKLEKSKDLKVQNKNLTFSELQPTHIDGKTESVNDCAPEATGNGEIRMMNNTRESLIETEKNLGINLQNGDGISPIPIKLVKCNDKFFFMTSLVKASSNQVDFVKLSNSDIVKNILAKRIQPTKVSVVGCADNLGSKRIIPVKSIEEKIELSNGKNGAEKETEKSENSDGNKFLKNNNNNSQQLEMQRLASSLKSVPSKSEPLKITIPPLFEATRKKQILVLKNNKLISVNTVNMNNSLLNAKAINSKQLAAPRSLLLDKNQDAKTIASNYLEGRNKPSLNLNPCAKISEGTSLLKPSISILKKPIINNLVKLEQNKSSGTILKINPTNSLLLNSNCAIPALQIATPVQSAPNDRRNSVQQNRNIAQMKLKRLPKNVKIDNQDDLKPPKVSVTLGKDKQKILSKRETYEDVLRSIETVEIKDTIGTLRFIMKRIPLITEEARDSDYKQMHPYACSTQEEFFNFHLGKQRAHEWYRAKMVRSLLKKKGFLDERLWSVREILNWARIHGYTPVQASLAIGNSNKTRKKLPDINSTGISTCTESLQFNEWLENCKDLNNSNDDSDVEVDVVHIAERKIKTEIKTEATELPEDTITLEIDPLLRLPCAFVNEAAREIGVKLQKEEIIPGVMDCTAERMIAKAMQCLVDDLVRRSLAKGWERNSNKCTDTIILDDVKGALSSRDEFDIFTNEGLGSLQNSG